MITVSGAADLDESKNDCDFAGAKLDLGADNRGKVRRDHLRSATMLVDIVAMCIPARVDDFRNVLQD